MHTRTGQRGAALITALIFLVIITMLSLSAMRSSILELRQSSNDEVRVAAFETTMGIIDAIIDTPANLAVVGEVGYLNCTALETGCSETTLTFTGGLYDTEIDDGDVRIRVERLSPLFRPPPRGIGTSARQLTAAAFKIEAEFNQAAIGQGRAALAQGIVIVVPKAQ